MIHGLDILIELKILTGKSEVLVLTMHDDEGYLHKVLERGGDGYILKKAADIELLTAIRAVNRDEIFLDPSLTKAILKNIYNTHRKETPEEEEEEEILSNREKEVLSRC